MKYLIVVAFFAFAAAQEREYPIFDRTCDARKAEIRPHVKTSFSVGAYAGTWFEVERYQQREQPELDCLVSRYNWNFVQRSFAIIRDGHDFAANQTFNVNATASLAHPDANPILGLMNSTYDLTQGRSKDISCRLNSTVKFLFSGTPDTNYYVIATDYFQFSVGWACEDLPNNQSREFAWLFSRDTALPNNPELLARIEGYIDRFWDRRFLRWTDQTPER